MAITPIRDLKGYLEPEQVEKVIAVATNFRDALLVRIPWRTGIRVRAWESSPSGTPRVWLNHVSGVSHHWTSPGGHTTAR